MRKCGRALRFDISSDAIPNLSRRPVSGLRRRSKVVMCQQGVQRRLELQPLQHQVLRPAPQLSLHPPDLTTHQPAGVYQFRNPNRIAGVFRSYWITKHCADELGAFGRADCGPEQLDPERGANGIASVYCSDGIAGVFCSHWITKHCADELGAFGCADCGHSFPSFQSTAWPLQADPTVSQSLLQL